jgi:hypothetical protein
MQYQSGLQNIHILPLHCLRSSFKTAGGVEVAFGDLDTIGKKAVTAYLREFSWRTEETYEKSG